METFCVFKVSDLKILKFYDKWQNCGRFEAKSVKNAQFKAKIKEKTDFGLFGSIILSRCSCLGTHWRDRMGGGEFV